MDNSVIQPRNYEVYLHLNTLNGKGYVGITCRGVRNRLYSHESEARHGSNKPFARAIRKYGLAAFETRVLAQGLTRDQAIEAEKQFVAEFETFGPRGYNATAGGDGAFGVALSDERRAAISKQFRELPRTEQHRARIAAALKGRPKTAAHVEAFSKATRGRKQSPEQRLKSIEALSLARQAWKGRTHTEAGKAAMRRTKSVSYKISDQNGVDRVEVTTLRALGEWAGISATALSVAIKKRRPIAKQGPLFGCLISKIEGNRNGWTT